MASKLLAVIERDRLDPRSHGRKPFNNGGADLVSSLSMNLDHFCIAAFSLHLGHDGMLVCRSNDGVALPVADTGASLNRFRPRGDRAFIWDLAPSIAAAGIAFALLFLAAQGAP